MATLTNFLDNSLTDLIQDSAVTGLEVKLNSELPNPSSAPRAVSHLPVCNCFVHQTPGVAQGQTSTGNQPEFSGSSVSNTSVWIAALNSGTRWTPSTSNGTPTLTYSFYLGGLSDSTYGALSNNARNFARQIFSDLSSYINVDFQEVEEVVENGTSSSPRGDIRLQTFTGSGYAYAYYTGDVYFNASYDHANDSNGFQKGIGSHGYMTIIHEIGHSLGLKHPGNYNGSGTGTGPFLDYGDDNTGNTVMSYNFAGRSAASLMPFDILALQNLYGARSWNTSNTTYTFTNLSSFSDGNRNWGSTTSDTRLTIWDSSGIDTLNLAGLTSNGNGYRFDLNDGGWLSVRTELDSTTYTARGDSSSSQYRTTNRGTRLAYGANIENLVGSSSNDEIIGNTLANTIDGGAGTDTLFELGDANMTLTNTSLSREGGNTDTISNIEQVNLTGGDGHNTINAAAFTGAVTLNGAAGDDNLTSSNSNDRLTGGSGSDTITGGDGTDLLVEVLDINMILTNSSLTSNSVGNNDILSSIEQASLTGGSSNNILDASAFAGPVTLSGEAGEDNLVGGNSNDRLSGGIGSDTIAGGNGTDILVEVLDINMTLTNSSLTSNSAGNNDILSSIEQASLTGGSGNNTLNASAFTGSVTLSGGAGADTLTGGTGNDSLGGGDGADYLDGGNGSDSLTGGAGDDAYSVGSGDLITELANQGNDFVYVNTTYTLGANLEHLILVGSATNGTGNNLNNYVAGNSSLGNTLAGLGGNDTLIGGAGNDSLSGGAGNDTILGGLGNDRVVLSGNRLYYSVTFNSVTSAYTVLDERSGSIDGTDIVSEVENFQFIDATIAAINAADIIIEQAGSVQLAVRSGNYVATDASNPPTPLTYAGSVVGPNSFANWSVIGTERIGDIASGEIEYMWKSTSNQFWYSTNINTGGVVQGEQLLTKEVDFQQDFNGDSIIGLFANQATEAFGTTTLKINASGQYVANNGDADINITYAGANVGSYSFAGWQVIAAEIDAGEVKAMWNSDNGLYWYSTNTSTGNLTAAEPLESTFKQDFDGDGFITTIGTSGDDLLVGNTNGSTSNDKLLGLAGDDLLTGGAGNDQFVFGGSGIAFNTLGLDTIADFASGDQISLSKSVFAALTSVIGSGFSVGSDFASVSSNADTSTALIVYNSTNGALFYNANGSTDGLGEGGQFAVLSGNPTLGASAFSIVA
jgi:Ca2+-binding RTX toxin-like protein